MQDKYLLIFCKFILFKSHTKRKFCLNNFNNNRRIDICAVSAVVSILWEGDACGVGPFTAKQKPKNMYLLEEVNKFLV